MNRIALAVPSLHPIMPIVGRRQELALLMRYYKAMKNGHAHVMLLSGEPGIGKTCLLQEVASRVSRNGALVLRGGASKAEGMPPYLPFLEALGQYLRHTSLEELRMQEIATLQSLASQFPELITRLGNPLANYSPPPEQARFRLYEAIGTLLGSIGTARPLVLILDDLHWADSASLDLLSHLMRRQQDARLLVLGAYRSCELNQNPHLLHALAELSHQRMLSTLTIGPLSRPEITTLAEYTLNGPLSQDASVWLYAQSEGNPFFAEELLQSWVERRSLVQNQDCWMIGTQFDHTLPLSITGVLRQRFAQLSPGCIDHLRVAAVIGPGFHLSLLAAVKESGLDRAEDCLLEAVRARLVRVEQNENFIFSHDYIRVCLYSEVSSSRRRVLHTRIGLVLESSTDQNKPLSTYQLAQLAFHFARSNDSARGIKYSELAGRQALQNGARAEAFIHYQIALTLLAPTDHRRSDLLLQFSQALLQTSQVEETGTVTTGEDPRLQLAQLLIKQADSDAEQGNVKLAGDLLRQALALFKALGMGAGTQQVRNRLQKLAQEPETVPALPCKLTRRQAMIIKLVTQGKSNRQIAQELGLTEKTVTNHLTHIFNRTNCENRSSLTAFAFRHGLA